MRALWHSPQNVASRREPKTTKKPETYHDHDPSRRRGARTTVRICLPDRLRLDELVTHRITPDQINEGFEMMKRSEVIRSVIIYQ
ncbi:MAG: hypothetical protein ABW049_04335 [Spongiibacteraceae bacterium]